LAGTNKIQGGNCSEEKMLDQYLMVSLDRTNGYLMALLKWLEYQIEHKNDATMSGINWTNELCPIPQQVIESRKKRHIEFGKIKQPEHYAPGQIWTTKVTEGTPQSCQPALGGMKVMLTVARNEQGEKTLMGVPIDEEWLFASSEDLVIEPDHSPLGSQAMLQLWCEIFLHPKSLNKYLGDINPEVFAGVQSFLDWYGGQKLARKPEYLFLRPDENIPSFKKALIRWQVQDNLEPNKFHLLDLGTRIITPIDPRSKYREIVVKEIECLRYPLIKDL
jgi:hypothetical protein